MTTVQITLPDALAQEATKAELLAPEKPNRVGQQRGIAGGVARGALPREVRPAAGQARDRRG